MANTEPPLLGMFPEQTLFIVRWLVTETAFTITTLGVC